MDGQHAQQVWSALTSIGQNGSMPLRSLDEVDGGTVDLPQVTAVLRSAGATFALIHGSRATGLAREGSDLDVAAWLPDGVEPWALPLPETVDLVSLRGLPLVIAGRIATDGVLLFDDDPPARVRWQADTRQRWSDEAQRRARITADILRAASGG